MTPGCSPLHQLLAKIITAFHYVRMSILVLLYMMMHPTFNLVKNRPNPPKNLIDPKYGEHKYAKVNGIKLHYVEKGDQSKPLMLFVHGFPEFWYSWRHQLMEFSSDYWCVAVDMRGYADSDKPQGIDAYKSANMVNDIKELVTHLGREKFHLVGHDWGAVIGMQFVDTYGSMLINYIAMSGPTSDTYGELIWSNWWQFTRSWYIFFFQGPYMPEISLRLNDLASFSAMIDGKDPKNQMTPDDLEAFKYTFSKPGALTPGINYYRANFLQNVPPYKKTDDLRGLWIIGDSDPYVSQITGSIMQKTYEGLETAKVRGGGHFIQQERPEDINMLMKTFLDKDKNLK